MVRNVIITLQYFCFQVKVWTHVKMVLVPMGLGLAAFERQARTGLSGCLPEQFGIQFSKVLKDSKQTDPLDFCFAFTMWRSMEAEQKVIT